MARVRIPYYTVRRNGRGFWEPNAAMRAAGFKSTPCGTDGPSAWAIADDMNRSWQRYRRGETDKADHAPPPGSIAEAWQRFMKTHEWAEKRPRTREDWGRAWRWIGPVFGDCDPRTVTLEKISELRVEIEREVSQREAHRVIKIWRAAWKTWAAMGYCVRDADPSLAVRNRAAASRSARWTDREARALVKTAWRIGYRGLSALLAVMWDSGQSPVDARDLAAAQIAWRGRQAVISWERAKTGAAPTSVLSRPASRVLRAWLDLSPAIGAAHVFRNRSGARYLKNAACEDFRAVRIAAFGEGEARQMQDFRRSAAMEAFDGGAAPATVARGLGNTLSASNLLFQTYAPPDESASVMMLDARKSARRDKSKKPAR